MSDLSITELLFAYGAWVSDDNNELGCKSPSLMLIKSAPKLCKDSVKAASRRTVAFISDDDALTIDKAMNALKNESLHTYYLYRILDCYFIGGWSYKRISEDYWSAIEYPCGTKQVAQYHIKAMVAEGCGSINGYLISEKRKNIA